MATKNPTQWIERNRAAGPLNEFSLWTDFNRAAGGYCRSGFAPLKKAPINGVSACLPASNAHTKSLRTAKMNENTAKLITQAGVVIVPTMLSAVFVEFDSAFRWHTSSATLLAVYLPSCIAALVVLIRGLKEPWWVRLAAAFCYVSLSAFITFIVCMFVVHYNTGD
jgi:hypothetical protein